MRSGYLGFGSALLFSLISVGTANAQHVSADIRIGGRGPVSGHVRIESSRDRYDYRRDYDYGRRVRVEIVRGRHDRGWRDGWYRQMRKARLVAIYYDRREDCYYDRFSPGLQEIRVYERDGRFYRLDDRYDDGYYDGRYDDRRYDDRGYDGRRDDGRYDGRAGRDGRVERSDGRGGRDGRNH